jgi:hypothetical protein
VLTGAAVLRIAYLAHRLQPSTARFSQIHIARFLIVDACLLVTVAGVSGILLSDRVFSDDFWFAQNFALDGLYLAISTTQIVVFHEVVRCGSRQLLRRTLSAPNDQVIRLSLPCCRGPKTSSQTSDGSENLSDAMGRSESLPESGSIDEAFERTGVLICTLAD